MLKSLFSDLAVKAAKSENNKSSAERGNIRPLGFLV